MLTKTSVVSPIDGIVTRLRVREGEMVVVGLQNQPGTTLMTISDLGAIDAEVKVAEADVLRLRGRPAGTVTLEALPGKRFTGTVVEIGASALPVTGTGAAAREFKVVVRLDAPDPGLRPGLTLRRGDRHERARERPDGAAPERRAAPRRGRQRAHWRLHRSTDGAARFTPVTTGVIGGLDIEVSGIDEGTSWSSGPYQVAARTADGAAGDASAS